MRLDKLQLDLYPRSNWQALDLGFSLLRLAGGTSYAAWLALWLPLVALCYALSFLGGETGYLWILLSWWLRPLLERVVIYVLSRAVFGEQVSWRAAVRAWPSQLKGGWFRLLTLWRPFMPGRGLYQPIWQLEQARGKFAAQRRRVIGHDKAAGTAYWFGLVCAHFEVILQFGLIALVGLFFASPEAIHPLALLNRDGDVNTPLITGLSYLAYAIASSVIAPIYTACCFTLYLNRRAELEAWDIELVLRQLKAPAARQTSTDKRSGARLAACVLPLLLGVLFLHPEPVQAVETCPPPKEVQERLARRGAPQNTEQARLRAKVDEIYQEPDLREYKCEMLWQSRNAEVEKKDNEAKDLPDWWKALFGDGKHGLLSPTFAVVIKYSLIAFAIALIAWLLYRYRDQLAVLLDVAPPRPAIPQQVAGMDIRPESLPDDVPAAARALWQQGQQRAALALLYRASLSAIAHQHGLALSRGATEGDCLRLAHAAQAEGRLPGPSYAMLQEVTSLWLAAAYANRWPDTGQLDATCNGWSRQFPQGVKP